MFVVKLHSSVVTLLNVYGLLSRLHSHIGLKADVLGVPLPWNNKKDCTAASEQTRPLRLATCCTTTRDCSFLAFLQVCAGAENLIHVAPVLLRPNVFFH